MLGRQVHMPLSLWQPTPVPAVGAVSSGPFIQQYTLKTYLDTPWDVIGREEMDEAVLVVRDPAHNPTLGNFIEQVLLLPRPGCQMEGVRRCVGENKHLLHSDTVR